MRSYYVTFNEEFSVDFGIDRDLKLHDDLKVNLIFSNRNFHFQYWEYSKIRGFKKDQLLNVFINL